MNKRRRTTTTTPSLSTLTASVAEVEEDRSTLQSLLSTQRCLIFSLAIYAGSYYLLIHTVQAIYYWHNHGRYSTVGGSVWIAGLFGLPFLFKPSAGQIADLYYPCRYRFKMYIFVVCLLNIGIFVGIRVHIARGLSLTVWFIALTVGAYMCGLVLLDSIAQGVTTIASQAEQQVAVLNKICNINQNASYSKKTEQILIGREPKILYYRNYTYFVMVITLMKAICYTLSSIFSPNISASESPEVQLDAYKEYFQMIFMIALGLTIPASLFIFIKEKKKKSSRNTRKRPSMAKILQRMTARGGGLLSLVCFLFTVNPSNYNYTAVLSQLITTQWNITDRQDLNLYSFAQLSGGLLCVALIWLVHLAKPSNCLRTRPLASADLYIFIVVLAQLLSNVGVYVLGTRNDEEFKDSGWSAFGFLTVMFAAECITQRLPSLCLIDNLMRRAPEGYEVLYTNVLVTMSTVGIFLGFILHPLSFELLSKEGTASTGLRYYGVCSAIATLITALVYLVWRAVSRDTSKN